MSSLMVKGNNSVKSEKVRDVSKEGLGVSRRKSI